MISIFSRRLLHRFTAGHRNSGLSAAGLSNGSDAGEPSPVKMVDAGLIQPLSADHMVRIATDMAFDVPLAAGLGAGLSAGLGAGLCDGFCDGLGAGLGAGLAGEASAEFLWLRSLFDRSFKAARIGVWECSLPDETLRWTDVVYELFDLSPQAPISREGTVKLYTEESRKRLNALREEAIRTGGGFTLDAEIITAKGNARWMRITATVEMANGVPVRIFGMKQDITAEKAMVDRIRHLADFDSLTGLASRARFEVAFETLCASDRAEKACLLLVDLDGFKQVNDRLGHPAGDACLKRAADRLVAALPDAEMVARIGGDEFAILHPLAAQEDLCILARRLVSELGFVVDEAGAAIAVGASVGAAFTGPSVAPKDIFSAADRALYSAKAAGKNGFSLATVKEAAAEAA